MAAGRQRRRWRLGNSDRLNLTSSSSRTSCMAFMSIDVTTLRRGTGVIIIYLSSCESFARRLRPCCSISSQRRIFILFFFFYRHTSLSPDPGDPTATRHARFMNMHGFARPAVTPSRFKCTAPHPDVVTGSECRRRRCVLSTTVWKAWCGQRERERRL